MNEKLVSTIKKYVIAFVVMGLISFLVLSLREFSPVISGQEKYLDLAAYFIDTRGTIEENDAVTGGDYSQSHIPVRQQTEAVGHSVRAMYLYTGMAMLAKETGDRELLEACKALWNDTTLRNMYVTGGLGSTCI